MQLLKLLSLKSSIDFPLDKLETKKKAFSKLSGFLLLFCLREASLEKMRKHSNIHDKLD